jgi:hypothetical protein
MGSRYSWGCVGSLFANWPEKKGREGEGRVHLKLPLSELHGLQYVFQKFFANVDSFYYDYYYQEHIFLICVYSLLFVVFLSSALRHFKCNVVQKHWGTEQRWNPTEDRAKRLLKAGFCSENGWKVPHPRWKQLLMRSGFWSRLSMCSGTLWKGGSAVISEHMCLNKEPFLYTALFTR